MSSNKKLTAVSEGSKIRITGAVPTGETFTVTYAVTVKAYDKQGNHQLGNVVAITGATPVCVDGSSLCTEHDVPKPPGKGHDPDNAWLPDTGAEISATAIVAALLLLGAGSGLLMFSRRRKVLAGGPDHEVDID